MRKEQYIEAFLRSFINLSNILKERFLIYGDTIKARLFR
jgi:hypothetical protein